MQRVTRLASLRTTTVMILAGICLAAGAASAGADTRASHRPAHPRGGCLRGSAARRGRRRESVCRSGGRTSAQHTGSHAGSALEASSLASAARARLIAQVLATPCEGESLTPEAGDLPQVRAAVLCLVNHVRAEHGVEPLSENQRLQQAAESHSQEMISENYFEHVSPSGETPVDRDRDAGYIPDPSDGYVIGENLAWGTLTLSTPQAIVAAWVASPGHLANILESQYTETGIGVLAQVPAVEAVGVAGATYAQEFGVIIP